MNKKIVVVVLGNRLNDDGTISNIQEERLNFALELDEMFKPSYFILSGGLANAAAGRTEAEAMYDYLVVRGVEESRLIKEDQSLTTIENAKYSCPIAKDLGADILIVCTSLYHLANPVYKALESFENNLRDTNIRLMTYSK